MRKLLKGSSQTYELFFVKLYYSFVEEK